MLKCACSFLDGMPFGESEYRKDDTSLRLTTSGTPMTGELAPCPHITRSRAKSLPQKSPSSVLCLLASERRFCERKMLRVPLHLDGRVVFLCTTRTGQLSVLYFMFVLIFRILQLCAFIVSPWYTQCTSRMITTLIPSPERNHKYFWFWIS